MSNYLDWTSGFELRPKPYTYIEHPDKLEVIIPVPGVKKMEIDLGIKPRYGKNNITVGIPDTQLSEKRDLEFVIGDDYDVKGTKANVRDGVLYMFIPMREENKPNKISIS